jgi:hypothetical protein
MLSLSLERASGARLPGDAVYCLVYPLTVPGDSCWRFQKTVPASAPENTAGVRLFLTPADAATAICRLPLLSGS